MRCGQRLESRLLWIGGYAKMQLMIIRRYFVWSLLAFGSLASISLAADPPKSPAVVGKYDDTVLTEDAMRQDIALDLYSEEQRIYQIKKDWIKKKAKDAFFNQAAKEAGLPRK